MRFVSAAFVGAVAVFLAWHVGVTHGLFYRWLDAHGERLTDLRERVEALEARAKGKE